jgi:hypothetical protein
MQRLGSLFRKKKVRIILFAAPQLGSHFIYGPVQTGRNATLCSPPRASLASSLDSYYKNDKGLKRQKWPLDKK